MILLAVQSTEHSVEELEAAKAEALERAQSILLPSRQPELVEDIAVMMLSMTPLLVTLLHLQ